MGNVKCWYASSERFVFISTTPCSVLLRMVGIGSGQLSTPCLRLSRLGCQQEEKLIDLCFPSRAS